MTAEMLARMMDWLLVEKSADMTAQMLVRLMDC